MYRCVCAFLQEEGNGWTGVLRLGDGAGANEETSRRTTPSEAAGERHFGSARAQARERRRRGKHFRFPSSSVRLALEQEGRKSDGERRGSEPRVLWREERRERFADGGRAEVGVFTGRPHHDVDRRHLAREGDDEGEEEASAQDPPRLMTSSKQNETKQDNSKTSWRVCTIIIFTANVFSILLLSIVASDELTFLINCNHKCIINCNHKCINLLTVTFYFDVACS